MKVIAGYLRDYVRGLNRQAFAAISLLMAILVCLNYTIGLERNIMKLPGGWQYIGLASLLIFVYAGAWLLQYLFIKQLTSPPRYFYVLMLAAPLIFAFKMSAAPLITALSRPFPPMWQGYANAILGWPVKAILVTALLAIFWRIGLYEPPLAGLSSKDFKVKPYLILLLFMVPLLAFAATQSDFLHTYPKLKSIDFIDYTISPTWPWKLLYELSYGSDFFTIELFFRGFLILAFMRYAGKDAILPMAAFYCTIHFGKPLFECITSYFGGLILGAVVYHTRSIWGGLIVHLGIAWLMELAGYMGNELK